MDFQELIKENEILSVKTLARKANIKIRKCIALVHLNEKLNKVKICSPLMVGSGKQPDSLILVSRA